MYRMRLMYVESRDGRLKPPLTQSYRPSYYVTYYNGVLLRMNPNKNRDGRLKSPLLAGVKEYAPFSLEAGIYKAYGAGDKQFK